MNSMTGFGRGEASNGDVTVIVEMKSVNNRFRDLQLRVPREYLPLEPRINAELRDVVHRGRVEVFVRRQSLLSGGTVTADTALARRVFDAMAQVAIALGRTPDAVQLSDVLAHEGVLVMSEETADAATEWDLVQTALTAALRDLLAMRAAEGSALRDDLRRHLDELLRQRAAVEAAAHDIVERLHARLQDRLTRLLGDRIDPARLAQEAAILVDKADVSEELARIASHCQQFDEQLRTDEPVGRKLDFLLQELNREINTIGSKAADQPITATVVEMKSTLERMREQAANVE